MENLAKKYLKIEYYCVVEYEVLCCNLDLVILPSSIDSFLIFFKLKWELLELWCEYIKGGT